MCFHIVFNWACADVLGIWFEQNNKVYHKNLASIYEHLALRLGKGFLFPSVPLKRKIMFNSSISKGSSWCKHFSIKLHITYLVWRIIFKFQFIISYSYSFFPLVLETNTFFFYKIEYLCIYSKFSHLFWNHAPLNITSFYPPFLHF